MWNSGVTDHGRRALAPPLGGLRLFGLLVRWQSGRLRALLPLLLIVQTLLASGLVIGLGFLVPETSTTAVLYLATGAPTVVLISVGFVIVPLQVSQAKVEGSYDFLRSLPVPRLAYLIADLALWLAVSLPGMALSLGLAALRYHVPLSLTPACVPVVLLVALTATSVGYGIAVLLRPVAAQLVSQALVFGILMFSPINFPVDRLPSWVARIHDVLPFRAMGDVIRQALAPSRFTAQPWEYGLLAAWCLVGLFTTKQILDRRS